MERTILRWKLVAVAFGFLLTLFCLSCGSAADAKQGGNPAPSMEVITIDTTSAVTFKEYSAMLEGKANVELRPQVDGYMEQVLIDEGAYVRAGQLLFKINDKPFREQLNSALAGLHGAEAQLLNAQLEIEKITPLVENKVVSELQLKTAKAAHQMAKANVEQAKATVASAQINLDFTSIKAPVNGYVSRLPKKVGSLVSRSDPQALTLISDVQYVHAYFSMSETDFMLFKAQYAGKPLTEKTGNMPSVSLVLADNSVYPYKGRVDMVDGQFDKNTGAISLRASFPNEQGLLRSGNTGKVRLVQHHKGAMLVPQQATMELQDKVFVFAVGDSNKVYKQTIEIIGKSGTDYLVKEGITIGSQIVFSGMERLQEGTQILPRIVADSVWGRGEKEVIGN
jgi:membrane fusion protein (multidrug efflux system)